ncbi:MAG TPA: DUF1287 domain-containing protein [Prosthecobacter sp.]|nr:DUF1287 domain-containing protein [Prosthecobacter sp.]
MRALLLCLIASGLGAVLANPQTLTVASRGRQPQDGTFAAKLVHAALDRTAVRVMYDGAYLKIAYPGGDVPAETGVCTDEVIRAYRALGVDLQKLVHEDMKKNFSAYPKQWGLTKTDSNIDHRRVPNLQTFFKRRGASLPVTQNAADYKPGDLITCTVAGRLPHIAVVVPAPYGGERPWIVHNIGSGPQLEDRLFEFPLTGHYRFHPQ